MVCHFYQEDASRLKLKVAVTRQMPCTKLSGIIQIARTRALNDEPLEACKSFLNSRNDLRYQQQGDWQV